MNISNSLSQLIKSNHSSISEHILLQNFLFPVTPLWQGLFQLSSLTIVYPNLGFNSYYLTLMVLIFVSFIPPSHHTVLWKLQYSPFLKELVLLEICLVCLVYLPLSAMQIADFLSNLIKDAFFGTTYVSLFKNSLFIILECASAIYAVHAELYSL